MPADHESPPLRVLYRHYGGDGDKPRPAYYSKLLALVSLLRAAEALDNPPQLVFLNDQVRPGPIRSLMEEYGEVLDVDGGSDARTYRFMLSREAARPGRPDQFLWFAEDDYLYRPNALRQLMLAVTALPDADYLTMYGSSTLDPVRSGPMAVERDTPGAAGNPTAISVDDTDWYRASQATSTFGTRLRTLREDLRLLRTWALTGGDWDGATCMALSGYRPYSSADLLGDLFPGAHVPLGGKPKAIARGAVRLAATGLSLRPQARHRKIYASDPEHILHMEIWDETTRFIPSERTAAIDWESVATQTVEWAAEKGIAVPPLVAS